MCSPGSNFALGLGSKPIRRNITNSYNVSSAVCTENLSPGIVVMQSAEDGERFDVSGPLNRAGATVEPAPQNNQLMPKYRVLSFKAQLRLERRGQDGQNETE